MKKTFLTLLLVLCAGIHAQSRHEFSLYGGVGWSTMLYDNELGKGTSEIGGGLFGLGYTFFFSEYLGLGSGAEYAYYRNKEESGGEDLHKQRVHQLQIPLMLQFQIGDWHKYYLAAGAKVGIPLDISSEFVSPKFEVGGKDYSDDLRTTFLASAETGMKWQLKEHLYLYTGAYLDYGLNSFVKDVKSKPFAVGLKLKLAFGSGSVVDSLHLKFSAGADSIQMGESTVLNWIAINANEASIEGIGPVPVEGSIKVNPSQTTRYTITAKGKGGEKTESVIVAVKLPPPPSIVFTVSPKTIQAGQVAALNWMVSNADEIIIKDVGAVPDKGTAEVKPSETIRYTIIAKGKGGEKTETVELVVEPPPGPSVIFNAVPGSIYRGQIATLNWITTDADEVSIEGIGSVPLKGTSEVKPSETTKYTLIAKGNGVTKTQIAEVIVEEPPPIEEKVNLKGVNFLSGKAELSLDAKKVLDGVAEQLLTYPNVKIEIHGYTDNVGQAVTNQKLSEARAKSVMNYLVSKGVKSNRMKATGYGPKQPIADNSTEEGRALNRRIEMVRVDK